MGLPTSPPPPTTPNFLDGRPPASAKPRDASADLGTTRWSRIKSFLARHPILCLALLTPGIPEYLSSSSPLSGLLTNPLLFFLSLAANLGLYLPGVVLIREAMIRWKKGWGSVLLLGAAYAILEEGIALETLFYSRAGPVGALGFYGHWLGVNWVWIPGVLLIHMIFSIALPILLLGLALPYTRGQSLVGRTGLLTAFVVWAIDIPVLAIVVQAIYHYWMGWPIFFASLAVIGLFVIAAYRAPANLLPTRSGPPRISPFKASLLGIAFFPPIWIFQGVLAGGHVLPAVTIAVILGYEAVLGYVVVRTIGTGDNQRQLVGFSAGIIAPLIFVGFIVELPLPVTVLADVAAVWFLLHLWRKYPRAFPGETVAIPPGVTTSG